MHYRGSFTDEYLDHQVEADHLAIWKDRLQQPSSGQYILLAEEKDIICGFACVYLDKDPVWGAFVDNLHVSSEWQGRGIGKALMEKVTNWIHQQSPGSKFYLYVLEKNISAIQFYERIGGTREGMTIEKNPGGGQSNVWRYVWI